jgi:hypothetical protein
LISDRGEASPGFRPQRRARLVTQIPTSRNHRQLAIEEFDYNNLVVKAGVGTTGAAPAGGRTNSRIATGAVLTQYREDLTSSAQCACQLVEMLIDLLLERGIEVDIRWQLCDQTS